jgi:hypothetical protein
MITLLAVAEITSRNVNADCIVRAYLWGPFTTLVNVDDTGAAISRRRNPEVIALAYSPTIRLDDANLLKWVAVGILTRIILGGGWCRRIRNRFAFSPISSESFVAFTTVSHSDEIHASRIRVTFIKFWLGTFIKIA